MDKILYVLAQEQSEKGKLFIFMPTENQTTEFISTQFDGAFAQEVFTADSYCVAQVNNLPNI